MFLKIKQSIFLSFIITLCFCSKVFGRRYIQASYNSVASSNGITVNYLFAAESGKIYSLGLKTNLRPYPRERSQKFYRSLYPQHWYEYLGLQSSISFPILNAKSLSIYLDTDVQISYSSAKQYNYRYYRYDTTGLYHEWIIEIIEMQYKPMTFIDLHISPRINIPLTSKLGIFLKSGIGIMNVIGIDKSNSSMGIKKPNWINQEFSTIVNTGINYNFRALK
jgi:hypothetical protein